MERSTSVGVPSIDEDKEEPQGSLARRNLSNHARSSVRTPTQQRPPENEVAEFPVASSEARSERKLKKPNASLSLPVIQNTIDRSFAELEAASEEMELKKASEKDGPSSPLSSPARRRHLFKCKKSGRNLTELMQLASAAKDQPNPPGSFTRQTPAAASCDDTLWETSPPARSVGSSASSHDSSLRELPSSPLASPSSKAKPKYGRSVSKMLADAAAVAAAVTPARLTRRARASPTASDAQDSLGRLGRGGFGAAPTASDDSLGRAGGSSGRAGFGAARHTASDDSFGRAGSGAARQTEESASRRASRLGSDSSDDRKYPGAGGGSTVGRNGIFGSLGEEARRAKEEGFGRPPAIDGQTAASCPDPRSSTRWSRVDGFYLSTPHPQTRNPTPETLNDKT